VATKKDGFVSVRLEARSSRFALPIETSASEYLARDIGEMGKKDMKKKIKYTDEPIRLGRRVEDFLPSPAEIALQAKTTRVTLNLNEESLRIFKKEAHRLAVPYQRLLRMVVDLYAQHHLMR
jgi:predicted DNA binding CopG/RHH family protein